MVQTLDAIFLFFWGATPPREFLDFAQPTALVGASHQRGLVHVPIPRRWHMSACKGRCEGRPRLVAFRPTITEVGVFIFIFSRVAAVTNERRRVHEGQPCQEARACVSLVVARAFAMSCTLLCLMSPPFSIFRFVRGVLRRQNGLPLGRLFEWVVDRDSGVIFFQICVKKGQEYAAVRSWYAHFHEVRHSEVDGGRASFPQVLNYLYACAQSFSVMLAVFLY